MPLFFTQTESKRFFEAVKSLVFVVLEVNKIWVKTKKVQKSCKFVIWVEYFIVTVNYVNGSRAEILLVILYRGVVIAYLERYSQVPADFSFTFSGQFVNIRFGQLFSCLKWSVSWLFMTSRTFYEDYLKFPYVISCCCNRFTNILVLFESMPQSGHVWPKDLINLRVHPFARLTKFLLQKAIQRCRFSERSEWTPTIRWSSILDLPTGSVMKIKSFKLGLSFFICFARFIVS